MMRIVSAYNLLVVQHAVKSSHLTSSIILFVLSLKLQFCMWMFHEYSFVMNSLSDVACFFLDQKTR